MAPPSWPELYIARLNAAIAFLRTAGFWVERVSIEAPVPSWRVAGYWGTFANEEVLALAAGKGWTPEAGQ